MSTSSLERDAARLREAEQAVLGAILLDWKCLVDVGLKPEDFYLNQHRAIFTAVRELEAAKTPIDLVTLTDRLHRTGRLALAGGAAYIAGLADLVPSTTNVGHYARAVDDMARRRELEWRLGRAMELVRESPDADTAEAGVEALLAGVGDREDLEGVTQGDVVRQWMADLDASYDKPTLRGIETGLPSLDEELFVHPTDLVVVGARPGAGKSMLASQVSEHTGRSRGPVLFVGLEMRPVEIIQRRAMDAGEVGIDDVRKPRTDEAARKVSAAADILHATPVRYIRSRKLTSILRAARRMKARGGLALLVIDYLQRMDFDPAWGDTRDAQIGHVTAALKSFSDDEEVPTLLLSQLKRPERRGPVRPPTIEDLRESGNIEADANAIILLHRPHPDANEEPKRRRLLAILGKQRSGPSGHAIELVEHFELGRIREPVPEPAPIPPAQSDLGFQGGKKRVST